MNNWATSTSWTTIYWQKSAYTPAAYIAIIDHDINLKFFILCEQALS